MEAKVANQAEKKKPWKRPVISHLARLGELTTPTTISASSPEKHKSSIQELADLYKKGQEESS